MNTIASLSAVRRTSAARIAVALVVALALTPAFAQSPSTQSIARSVEPDVPVDAGPIDAPPDVAPGDYQWTPELAPSGPVVIVVSLPEQRLHVYRAGVRIGLASISTGREGKETPTGIYPILQKEIDHRSNLYDDAPMPYMQRLTWDGIALHEGRVPGYPASHGCIRLPAGFAQALFDVTERGTMVVVADELSNSSAVVWPGETVPVDAYTGLEPGQLPPVPDMSAPPAMPVAAPSAAEAVATN